MQLLPLLIQPLILLLLILLRPCCSCCCMSWLLLLILLTLANLLHGELVLLILRWFCCTCRREPDAAGPYAKMPDLPLVHVGVVVDLMRRDCGVGVGATRSARMTAEVSTCAS
jgi:hypothetical protein